MEFTVGDAAMKLTATIEADAAADKRVIWSVEGAGVTLYTDADCQNALERDTPVDTLEVYVKPVAAGNAKITATSVQDSTKSDTCDVTVINKKILATAKGYTGVYDGNEYGITVTVTDPSIGATVKYGLKEGKCNLSESPKIADVADSPLIVFYEITAEGYDTETGFAIVVIVPAEPEIPGERTAIYGQTLADVELPDGWAWVDDTTNVGNVGTHFFPANYTAPDRNTVSKNNVELKVKVLPVQLKITAASATKVYDGEPLTDSGYTSGSLVNGDVIESVKVEGSQTDVGKSANVASGAVIKNTEGENAAFNYKITYVDGELEVTKALSNEVTVDITGWIYGDEPNEPVATAKFGTPTISYGTSKYGTFTEEVPVDAGTYFVKAYVEGTDNYPAGEAYKTFKIEKRKLYITADPQSKVEGEPDPELTYTYENLVDGDTITGKLSRVNGEQPGTYAIRIGTLSAGKNYTIVYTGANLTIEKKAPVCIPPKGRCLESDCTYQQLVIPGYVDGGTYYYAVSKTSWLAPMRWSYSTAIPTAKDPGTYYVWYKVVWSDGRSSTPVRLTTTITQQQQQSGGGNSQMQSLISQIIGWWKKH